MAAQPTNCQGFISCKTTKWRVWSLNTFQVCWTSQLKMLTRRKATWQWVSCHVHPPDCRQLLHSVQQRQRQNHAIGSYCCEYQVNQWQHQDHANYGSEESEDPVHHGQMCFSSIHLLLLLYLEELLAERDIQLDKNRHSKPSVPHWHTKIKNSKN